MHLSQPQKDCIVVASALLLGVLLYFLQFDFSLLRWAKGSKGNEVGSIYLIGFAITFIGNGSILFPIPYAAAIPILAIYLPSFVHQIILGVICGVAAGVGEMTAYGVGYVSRKTMSDESKENVEYLTDKFSRSNPVLLFLVGLMPIPDEFVVVPLATAGYPFRKMIFFASLGKILLCIFLSWVVGPILGIGLEQSGSSRLFSSGLAVAFALLFYLFIRIDWKKVL